MNFINNMKINKKHEVTHVPSSIADEAMILFCYLSPRKR